MASLPYPRSHKTIFPQNPTQPNHLCASVRICGRLFSARSFCVFCEFCGRTLRSHQTIFPQNSRNTQKRLAEKKNLCASVKSVGKYPPLETSVNSVNSVGGLAQTNLEWVLWKEFGGLRGYGRDAIPSYENSHGLHRCAQIRRVWHPCHTHAATKLSSHRIHGPHRNDWRRRKICEFCEIRGRLFYARSFCGFCVFRGRFLSEAMLVQRRPLHPLVLLQAFHLFYWQA